MHRVVGPVGLLVVTALMGCAERSPPKASGALSSSHDNGAPLSSQPSRPFVVPRRSGQPVELANPSTPWPAASGPFCPRYVAVATVGIVSCAVCENGEAHCWGEASSPVTQASSSDVLVALHVSGIADAVSVAVSGLRACVVTRSANVLCWGQLDRIEAPSSHGSIGARNIALPAPAVSVAAGDQHACALLSTNEVACWGANDYGQLGIESTQSHVPPTVLPGLRARQLVAAGNATCVIDQHHRPVCWGWNGSGLLGDRSMRSGPRVLTGMGAVDQLVMDGGRACAKGPSGTWCWGGDELSPETWAPSRRDRLAAGRLAAVMDDTVALLDASVLRLVRDDGSSLPDVALAPVQSLAARAGSWCAILQAGALRCWGRTFGGALVLR